MRIQRYTLNYPLSFFLFLFVLLSSDLYSQDRITTAAGTILNVKIIHIDAENLYFHQTIDTSKTIRKVSLKSIRQYEYNSNAIGNNKQTLVEDSLLFAKYLREVEGVYYTKNHTLINIKEQQKLARRDSLSIVKFKKNPTAKTSFIDASGCLFAASAFLIAGAAINIYAENREIKENPTGIEIDIYLEEQKALRTGSSILYGISGLFIVGAGINLHSGAMKLNP